MLHNAKGIVLAAGAGTRMFPASLPISKVLLPIYDKPAIYYPIATLMTSGIMDIMIITSRDDLEVFKGLISDGSWLGLNIQYEIQHERRGIADAFLIAEDFIGKSEVVVLILGDNVFYAASFATQVESAMKNNIGATVFGYTVNDPHRYGIVELNRNGKAISLEEKPENPRSSIAVTGLYIYDQHVCEYAKQLIPSARGELEITDLNRVYMQKNQLTVELMGKDSLWFDTGTPDSMLEASNSIMELERKTMEQIACLEVLACQRGLISPATILQDAETKPGNAYYDYIRRMLRVSHQVEFL
ncbi:MAG: NTP transferase domain-containing protein [Holosporales bacterium]|jgi:glucose-1-phosphate thymidylyltransferase|nr:NTP transferase domain-containing protein [Holosporales bacterium]